MENNNVYDLVIPLVVPVVSTFMGIIASIITSKRYWKQKQADLEAEYLSRFNTKKWEIYTEFIKLTPQIISNNPSTEISSEETCSIDSLAAQIVLTGSDNVVTAFRVWREAHNTYEQGHEITKEKLSSLIAKMRIDLGNQYTQLDIDDLIGALKPFS